MEVRRQSSGPKRGGAQWHDAGPRKAHALRTKRVPIDFKPDRDFRILSIDGGGIRGTFAAAFLAELERRAGQPCSRLFDLVAGTSTGAIVAAGLAAGIAAERIEQLYVERGSEIFPPDGPIKQLIPKALRGLFAARFSDQNLRRVLHETMGTMTFSEAFDANGIALCIPTSDTQIREVHIFKTPHHPDYHLDRNRLLADATAASASAPSYFLPYTTREGYILTDGGLWANNPILLAAIEANVAFGVPFNRMVVLSIGYGQSVDPTTFAHHQFGGLWHWRDAIHRSIDLQGQNALSQTRLLVGPEKVARIEIEAPNLARIELDDWNRAHVELPPAGREAYKRANDAISSLGFETAIC